MTQTCKAVKGIINRQPLGVGSPMFDDEQSGLPIELYVKRIWLHIISIKLSIHNEVQWTQEET